MWTTYTKTTGLQGGHDAGTAVGQLFGSEAGGEHIKIHATQVGGNVVVHQAQLPGLLDYGPRVLAGLVVLGGYRDDLFPGELPCQLLQLLLLLGEGEGGSIGGHLGDGGIGTALGHQLAEGRRSKLSFGKVRKFLCY